MKHEMIIKQMTLEEKAAFLIGKSEWQSRDIPRLDIPSIFCSDGPHGIRKQEGTGDHLGINKSLPATCFPTAATVANSWDEKLGEEIGRALGEEAACQGVDILLGPGLNIKRSPLCGRNFEYFSEDPYLAGKMAASYIKGIQSQGVKACPKHFALNEQEMNRCSFLLTYADEQAIREIYLKPFELCVKNYPTKSLAVMSSFNFIGPVYCGANPNLLNNILRGEWGFEGMVMTDWDGSYGYQVTEQCVRNGNDLMLGFLQHESNQMENLDSPTLIKSLRQASKNIMYTVVNSAAYEEGNINTGLSPMTRLFVFVDTAIGILSVAIMVYVILRWSRKRQAQSKKEA